VYIWVSSENNWWFRECEEIRALKGVVYKLKSMGPRTDPWGTPYFSSVGEDTCSFTFTLRVRFIRYEENQVSTSPWRPNQIESRSRSMLWSIVSNAAERSSMHSPVKRWVHIPFMIVLQTERRTVSVDRFLVNSQP
jgi:hypothetical protein